MFPAKKLIGIFLTGIYLCAIFSCVRFGTGSSVHSSITKTTDNFIFQKPSAKPEAFLKPGKQPLWFQLTEDGPVHIESIEDAVMSAALIPWPLALHARFLHERRDELFLAINRGGFLKIAPYSGDGLKGSLAMYYFSGGLFWKQYTIGGFIFYDDKPAVLLYLDNRFLDSDASLPHFRTWTFNMETNTPFPIKIPVLEIFSAEEGWDIDTLHSGPDGLIYYRARKINNASPEIRMLRTSTLSKNGEEIPLDVFYNSSPHKTENFSPLLPPLPEGFVYTAEGRTGDNLLACWEEQADFNIGAAGFVVIKD